MATRSNAVPFLFRPMRGGRLLKHLMLAGFGLLMLYPLLWMISSSLKPEELIFREPGLLPSTLTLENYSAGWNALKHSFGYYLWNSAVITGLSVLANLVACSLAAYAFARLNFPLKKLWFAIMLGSIMLPHHVTVVPQYILFSNLDWINTIWPLVVPKFLATDAFFIFLMVQFIRTLPRELDEAAAIDGAGYWRVFLQVILPLCTPALATTGIFTFIWTWNDFFSQNLYLTNSDNLTVAVALRQFLDSSGESSWGPMFAMSIVSLGPIFGFFLAGQKYLIRGVATTGLK
ncbi:carbohydrate ABC transporter permease [Nonomuraea roseoviolacea]|uniref:Multiple sugar transport system permease protein n=1 Tax=Nonomuraea roseoviolacea subsp. carminata TaxID=160689 RepID=A0ABT1JUG2_9ACTN|nr:carbohydrate ABC transporter permease [Nonomuraea roseoviolacea]MCP2344931.1 multiple sugar transport system permease protein [Nonomuraea roseoviolacea subsp. carminata]